MTVIEVWALAALGIFIAANTLAPNGQEMPHHADLKSKWAKDVSPSSPLPEYPRMQMQRKEWLNLNGQWDWKPGSATDLTPTEGGYDQQILVPFPIESELSGVAKHVGTIWYRKVIALPPGYAGKDVLLHFGASNWKTDVWLNGQKVGSHTGGYSPFTLDITSAIDPNKPGQLLEVRVYNPVDAGTQPRGKQVLKPEGIFYTPCTGIWQTVWMEPVNRNHIEQLHLTPHFANQSLEIESFGNLKGCLVEATAFEGDHPVGTQKWSGNGPASIALKDLHPWTPEDPYLYRLEVKVFQEGAEVDHVSSYFAMRSISVQPDHNGVPRIFLNGKPLFQLGVLDQGYWPDGIYTAPTDAALKSDIEEVKSLGMNLIRKHAKTEPDRWYYWTDKLGILVWQDMPQTFNKEFPEPVKQEFKTELNQMVTSLWNHPSIVVWTLFNEGWGQYDTESLTEFLVALDPSRLINSASGWTDKGCGDFIDAHHYPEPVSPPVAGRRARVLGEYGGLGFAVKGHLWTEGWSYKMNSSKEDLTQTYIEYLKDIQKLEETEGLSAAVYTQITDVEQEINGLFTYDRAVLKMDKDAVEKANKATIDHLTQFENGQGSERKTGSPS